MNASGVVDLHYHKGKRSVEGGIEAQTQPILLLGTKKEKSDAEKCKGIFSSERRQSGTKVRIKWGWTHIRITPQFHVIWGQGLSNLLRKNLTRKRKCHSGSKKVWGNPPNIRTLFDKGKRRKRPGKRTATQRNLRGTAEKRRVQRGGKEKIEDERSK